MEITNTTGRTLPAGTAITMQDGEPAEAILPGGESVPFRSPLLPPGFPSDALDTRAGRDVCADWWEQEAGDVEKAERLRNWPPFGIPNIKFTFDAEKVRQAFERFSVTMAEAGARIREMAAASARRTSRKYTEAKLHKLRRNHR